MKRPLIAALVGLVLVLTSASAASAAPSEQPGGRLLILDPTGQPEGWAALYGIQPSGAGRQDLHLSLTVYASPDYSPDGTRIVYISPDCCFGIAMANADGTGAHEVAGAPFGPYYTRWSPTGDWISVETGGDIWRLHEAGTEFGWGTMTGYNSFNHLTSDWSPDGRRVAVTTWDDHPDIWLYPADGDGTNPRRLTNRAGWHPYRMSWSARGNDIVVESDGDLFTVGVPSGRVKQLTSTPGVAESSPVHSADGRWLAYASTGADGVSRVMLRDPYGAVRATGIVGIPTSWRAQP